MGGGDATSPKANKTSKQGSKETSVGGAKAPRTRKRRWTRVPSEWQPNDEHRGIAKAEGVDFERQLENFRDHDFARPKVDPDAAFRNWLRNPIAKQGSKNGAPKAQQGMASTVKLAMGDY